MTLLNCDMATLKLKYNNCNILLLIKIKKFQEKNNETLKVNNVNG